MEGYDSDAALFLFDECRAADDGLDCFVDSLDQRVAPLVAGVASTYRLARKNDLGVSERDDDPRQVVGTEVKEHRLAVSTLWSERCGVDLVSTVPQGGKSRDPNDVIVATPASTRTEAQTLARCCPVTYLPGSRHLDYSSSAGP